MDLDTTSEFAIFGDYVYYEPILEVLCYEKSNIKSAFLHLQENLKKHKRSVAVGFVSYELGMLEYGLNDNVDSNILDSCALNSCSIKQTGKTLPLLFFVLYKKREKLTKIKILPKSSVKFLPTIVKNIDKTRYKNDFLAIKTALKQGNTYQINYTQELHLQSKLNGLEIFKHILPRQHTKHKAYLNTPYVEICSFSPELFFKLKGRKIIVKPMKGTMPREVKKTQDNANKARLKHDTKNIAENIMIVDLLRNDLHKIAHNLRYKLLQIKSYKTLHQMTSTISATLRKNSLLENPNNNAKTKPNLLYEIFAAIFPCGSISGAPKKASIEIIKTLEKRERGIYCGAIGVISHKKGQNQATFSVPIRTLFRLSGEHIWRYGVGSGVVWDSKANEEIAELELKSSLLFRQDYALIETMLLLDNRVFLLDSHINRITKSGQELSFDLAGLARLGLMDLAQKNLELPTLAKSVQDFMQFNPLDSTLLDSNAWKTLPRQILNTINQNVPKQHNKTKILRLLLHKNGETKIEILPFKKIKSNAIKIAKDRLDSRNDALYHKSTLRAHFTQDSAISEGKMFDVIYLNERGEVCEGSRSNIVILQKGSLYTPSLKSGTLNGCLRNNFVWHKIVREKTLHLEDLYNAQKIFCINSVRGINEVFL